MLISQSAASRPIASFSIRTVVSGGSVYALSSMSSIPTTASASGTRTPRSRAARSAPMAMASVTAKSAVGGSGRPRRLRVASVAASTPISVRRTSAGSCAIAPAASASPVALERLRAEGVAHRRAEKRDPPMAEPDEMLGREPGARLVVGHHGREVRPGHVVVDEDDREAAMPEAQEEAGVERAHHQRPVDGAVAQHAARGRPRRPRRPAAA